VEKAHFVRISRLDAPCVVIPEKLEHLMVWLLAEKLLRINPDAGDNELVSVLNSDSIKPLARRILSITSDDPRWELQGENRYEFLALAGFTFALRGVQSASGTPAYNDLRERMGLPIFLPPADTGGLLQEEPTALEMLLRS